MAEHVDIGVHGEEHAGVVVTDAILHGRPVTHVSGTLQRDGVPSRVAGVFVGDGPRTTQVLCFYSDPKGARVATRILRSVLVD